MDMPIVAPQRFGGVQQWLAEHPHFQMHYAPIVIDLFRLALVQRCFAIIATLPVQDCLVEDIKWITKCLAGIPDQDPLVRIVITKQRAREEKPSEHL